MFIRVPETLTTKDARLRLAERHTSIVTKVVRKKKLVAIGNSLAFFVDKPFRRMLGINANTLLDVTTDGTRLIIEPAGQRDDDDDDERESTTQRRPPPKEVTVGYRARGVYESLINDFGLTQEHYLRLQSGYARRKDWRYWREWLAYPMRVDLPCDRVIYQRFETCWEALDAGSGWEAAIQTALAAFPFENEPPSGAGVSKPALDAGPLPAGLDPDLDDVAEP